MQKSKIEKFNLKKWRQSWSTQIICIKKLQTPTQFGDIETFRDVGPGSIFTKIVTLRKFSMYQLKKIQGAYFGQWLFAI